MQNTPQQPPKSSKWSEVWQIIWRAVKNNLGFKILALIIAIVMWSGLITQDPTLTREKTFNDVKITVAGSDAIKRNGMIVTSDLDELLGSAQLRVDVPQMQYNNATANIFNVRIDLSRVSQTGPQEIKVLTTNSVAYGSVSEVTPSSIQIEVEEYITRYRIPVNVKPEGEAPEGFYAGTAQPDPPMVAVSGPRSLVERIVQAEAVLELSHMPAREGNVRTAAAFYLLDEEGNRVESDLLSVTSESVLLDSVVVEQSMYSTKAIELSGESLLSGKPAEGYEVKSVTCTPSIIKAAGRAVNLELLDSLYASSTVDVSGKAETFQQQLRVRRPTELIYLSADTVTVEVEIGPIIKQQEFSGQKVELVNLGEGLRASVSSKTADLTITGPQLWVRGLRSYHVSLKCDAEGLTDGEYDLPVICTVQNDEGQTYSVDVEPATIHVTIK